MGNAQLVSFQSTKCGGLAAGPVAEGPELRASLLLSPRWKLGLWPVCVPHHQTLGHASKQAF